jgi:hypothetical protein
MEMATDPKFTKGWFGPSSDENGDICNGQTASITVGPNTWAVQRQYSKADDVSTNGVTFCVVEAPNPMPELAGGPAAGVTGIARVQMLQQLYPLLPLPAGRFDVASKKVTMDEAELEAYAHRLFSPFAPGNLVPGLPQMLRQFADHLEKKK